MSDADRDIDGIFSPYIDAVAVQGDYSLSAKHEPMLGPAAIPLVAHAQSRLGLETRQLQELCRHNVHDGSP